MRKVLTAASRAGELAVAQTEIVIAAVRKVHPDIEIRIKEVTTGGDRDRQTALWDLKSSGFFTSQVEEALTAGQADFAVHSFKDLPTESRAGLVVAAVLDRRFVEDCVIAAEPVESIEQLAGSAKVGTSSLRRAAQLKHLRPDLGAAAIRGNVPTRIRKLAAGDFDAIILARAGLERLGLGERISFCLEPTEFLPAAAQGALAVQTSADDTETSKLIGAIDDKNARTAALAERRVLAAMRAGCHAPVGAFARIRRESIMICAFISDVQGLNYIRRELTGPVEQAEGLAERIAEQLLGAGGQEILDKLASERHTTLP